MPGRVRRGLHAPPVGAARLAHAAVSVHLAAPRRAQFWVAAGGDVRRARPCAARRGRVRQDAYAQEHDALRPHVIVRLASHHRARWRLGCAADCGDGNVTASVLRARCAARPVYVCAPAGFVARRGGGNAVDMPVQDGAPPVPRLESIYAVDPPRGRFGAHAPRSHRWRARRGAKIARCLPHHAQAPSRVPSGWWRCQQRGASQRYAMQPTDVQKPLANCHPGAWTHPGRLPNAS
jgi:hypothetical protein